MREGVSSDTHILGGMCCAHKGREGLFGTTHHIDALLLGAVRDAYLHWGEGGVRGGGGADYFFWGLARPSVAQHPAGTGELGGRPILSRIAKERKIHVTAPPYPWGSRNTDFCTLAYTRGGCDCADNAIERDGKKAEGEATEEAGGRGSNGQTSGGITQRAHTHPIDWQTDAQNERRGS